MEADEEAAVTARARAIEARVGHPGRMWEALKERVQDNGIRFFRDVQDDWLALMWTLDAYRRESIPPIGMGNLRYGPQRRLEAIIRSKGNYFAELIALLLQNRTNQPIRPRTKVRGFSQPHQVDVAWPSRDVDPLICAETKVTGGPGYGSTRSRGAMNDFSNRRKELKFAATDLKLWRRQQDTAIHHWGVWRSSAPPKTYFLWAARLRNDLTRGNDDIRRLVDEAKALVDTYLEGAGIFAWEERGGRYQAVQLPAQGQITELDDVLYRIESEIRVMTAGGSVPPPQQPSGETVDVERLTPDTNTQP
jgi:hypothetical protein